MAEDSNIITYLIAIIIFLFGLAMGSFLNVLIYRLPKEKEVVKTRSFCPKCKKQLLARDLIPLASFLILGGKCRFCKIKIFWQYPLIELTTGALFLLIYLFNPLKSNLL